MIRSRLRSLVLAVLLLDLGLAASWAATNEDLQLEVFIDGRPTQLIASFVRLPDGRIGTTKGELGELGLEVRAPASEDKLLVLDDIAGLRYRYDEPTQRLHLTVDPLLRRRQDFDLRRKAGDDAAPAASSWGAVVNYDLLFNSNGLLGLQAVSGGSASLALTGRMFSPYGAFEQSAIASATRNARSLIRLGSVYEYSDPAQLMTYRAGDTISNGLSWSQPIRIGGLQAQSDFALRPDLITMPLPNLGGTAAVPSTVEVYVNNIRTFSQQIDAGPFSISNVPLVTGAGTAQLVVRDSAGHETRTDLPFYASSSLLAPGLMNWSVEAGFPRLWFGSAADTYMSSPVGSGSVRRGVTDWLTAEGHAEIGAGLVNAGAGAVVRTGAFGLLSAAASASRFAGRSGAQAFVSYETRLFGLGIGASSQRSFGIYDNLGSATARIFANEQTPLQIVDGILNGPVNTATLAPVYAIAQLPREIDRLTLGMPFPFDPRASISSSFIHQVDGAGKMSNIATVGYSRGSPLRANLSVTAFADLSATGNRGIFAGLSMPLTDDVFASSSVSGSPSGKSGTIEANKTMGQAPGSYGWRVQDSPGGASYRSASLSYRSAAMVVQAGVSQFGRGGSAALELRGSIVGMDGDVFLADSITDAFAVVDAGAPGVKVFNQNRLAGTTDSRGLLLVPYLLANQKNKISVDPTDLPLDRDIAEAVEFARPAGRSGVRVEFASKKIDNAALVVFKTSDGGYVPAGSAGRLEGGAEFVVGYDGEAFVEGLNPNNSVTIELANGSCRAEFSYAPAAGEQVRLGPIECRASAGKPAAKAPTEVVASARMDTIVAALQERDLPTFEALGLRR